MSAMTVLEKEGIVETTKCQRHRIVIRIFDNSLSPSVGKGVNVSKKKSVFSCAIVYGARSPTNIVKKFSSNIVPKRVGFFLSAYETSQKFRPRRRRTRDDDVVDAEEQLGRGAGEEESA